MSLILILALTVMGSAFAEGQAAGSQLGFEVLRALSDGTKNQVISPVSLAYALAMAAQGASGETRQELLDALGAQSAGEVAGLTGSLTEAGLKLANAAFVAEGFEPEADYIAALREQFGAEWFEDDGNLVEAVNEWAKEQTDGLIDQVLDDSVDHSSALILLNAVAMDAAWVNMFIPEYTSDGTFHSPDGDVTVPMMHNELTADYGERDGVQMLRLGYQDSGLALLIALPGEGGVEAVLDALCQDGLPYFQFEEEQRRVSLSMPKMDLSADNNLNDVLQALGVERAFADEADFSGISSKNALSIDSVIQKARLTFDEEGTRAAAVTGLAMAMSAYNPATIVEFSMDRPFVAVIADEASGAVCFAGVVANPSGN